MKRKDIDTLSDLKPDPRNARKHTERNVGMIRDALAEVGAARSIVIDERGVILAGNAAAKAATAAGLKLQVVDADGETVVAVRRTGLSAEQKTRLALFDNRAAEEAEWDTDILSGLEADGLLDGMWSAEELEELLTGHPNAAEWGAALGSLPDGDKSPFQQMTFTVSDDQAEEVKAALDRARDAGPFVDTGNDNGNGNALARICEAYRGR